MIHPVPRPRGREPRVSFLCTGNSARSQMAEALLDTRSGGSAEARSAGSHPEVLHAGRAMPDGARPEPGGWNRIHLLAVDLDGEIERLEGEGVPFRNDLVSGPGGRQILVTDASGNLVELFPSADP